MGVSRGNITEMGDLFVREYDASELKIAAEFLTNWLPFLTKDLCEGCTASMRDRIRSLDPGLNFSSFFSYLSFLF